MSAHDILKPSIDYITLAALIQWKITLIATHPKKQKVLPSRVFPAFFSSLDTSYIKAQRTIKAQNVGA